MGKRGLSQLNESNSVPIEPFLAAFERSGISAAELALLCGRNKSSGREHGDDTWTKRILGFKPEYPSAPPRTRIRIEIAEEMAKALHLDPFECGL